MFNDKRPIAVVLGCLAIVSASHAASAAPILDQSFLGGGSSLSGEAAFAQAFTVGIAGRLSRVDLKIFGDVDVTVEIRRTTLGAPLLSDDLADQLGSVTLTPPPLPAGLVSVDLRRFHIGVTPGDVLAIVLRGDGVHNWFLGLGAAATYPGGEAFLRESAGWRTIDEVFPTLPDGDFQFQTFVVPEPASLSVLGLGAAWLVARRRRAR